MTLRGPPPPAVLTTAEPGTSPFHVKGNVYLGTQQFFATQVEGGVAALIAAIDDPKLKDFIQQKFLPVAWYDALPAAPLIRAEAKAMGLKVSHYLRLRSTF